MEAKLKAMYAFLDGNFDIYVKRLSQLISVKSISSNEEYRPELYRMIHTIANFMKSLNMEVKLKRNRKHYLPGKIPKEYGESGDLNISKYGRSDDMPPIILAELGDDKRKGTLLIYCHIDVDVVNVDEIWPGEPFEFNEEDETMYARGIADNKAQLLIWLCVIEGFQRMKVEIPLNIKFVIDPLEESGSEGLAEILYEERTRFLKNVDDVCIPENYWFSNDTPCLGYGLRGISYYFIEVICAKRNLHSGVYGGCIHEAMADLVYLMNSLTDNQGHIKVPHIYDNVIRANATDKKCVENTSLDLNALKVRLGVPKLMHHTTDCLLEHRANLPSLSLHGIRGSFDGIGARTIIPHRVIGKFSIRLVPDMDPFEIHKHVTDHIMSLHAKRSPNYCRVYPFHCNKAWITTVHNDNFKAAETAIEAIWGKKPEYFREGASVPIVTTLQDMIKKNIILLPLAGEIDSIHRANEENTKTMVIKGMQIVTRYILELGVSYSLERR